MTTDEVKAADRVTELVRYIDEAKAAAGSERVSGEPLAEFIARTREQLLALRTRIVELEAECDRMLPIYTAHIAEEQRVAECRVPPTDEELDNPTLEQLTTAAKEPPRYLDLDDAELRERVKYAMPFGDAHRELLRRVALARKASQ